MKASLYYYKALIQGEIQITPVKVIFDCNQKEEECRQNSNIPKTIFNWFENLPSPGLWRVALPLIPLADEVIVFYGAESAPTFKVFLESYFQGVGGPFSQEIYVHYGLNPLADDLSTAQGLGDCRTIEFSSPQQLALAQVYTQGKTRSSSILIFHMSSNKA